LAAVFLGQFDRECQALLNDTVDRIAAAHLKNTQQRLVALTSAKKLATDHEDPSHSSHLCQRPHLSGE
jgi:hypothetical protein